MRVWKAFAEWGAAGGLCLASLVAAGWIGMAPAPGAGAGKAGLLAAVYPPWWPGQRVFIAASAAGPVVGFGAVPFVVIAAPGGPDGAAALGESGAWLVLDARLVRLCGERTGLETSL